MRKAAVELVDEVTGEIILVDGDHYDRAETLLARYKLQDTIRSVLPDGFLHKGKPARHRVKTCLHSIRGQEGGKTKNVEVHKSKTSGNATYKNLTLCGSVWTCPICGAKISERRAAHIQSISDQHLAAGGSMVLVTLTFSHKFWESPEFLADGLTKAWSGFQKDRTVKNTLDDFGVVGGVRSLEVTWGEDHGWHPHIHVLLYTGKYVDIPRHISVGKKKRKIANPVFEGSPRDRLEKALFARWLSYCKKQKLGEPNEKHGVRVDNGDFASEYVSKHGDWNSAKEITKQGLKKAKGENYKPFELAAAASMQVNGILENEVDFGDMYRQYCEAFYRKQQVVWYRLKNLKSLYEFEELADADDQTLAMADEDELFLIGELTRVQWWRVVEHKKRAEVLLLAEAITDDPEENVKAISRFLDQLPPSRLESELLALEHYSRDKRVKERKFDNSPDGRRSFFKHLQEVRFSSKFGSLLAQFSNRRPCADISLWNRHFGVVNER